jgi:hypothetical protein
MSRGAEYSRRTSNGSTLGRGAARAAGDLGYSIAGDYPVQVTATDDHGAATTTSVAWTVTHTNRPPEITLIPPQKSAEGSNVDLTPTVTDADGDPVTVTVKGLPAGLSADGFGHITGTVAYRTAGGYTVAITATDNHNGTTTTSGVSFK